MMKNTNSGFDKERVVVVVEQAQKAVLIAIGGNALFDADGGNNIDPMKIRQVCEDVVKVAELGYQPLVTFGNGPQVGNLLEMSEKYNAPPKWPIPLDVCVSWTQAEIGYALTKEIQNQLIHKGLTHSVLALNTTVVVDANDPAFLNPTKYVGNFFTQAQAEELSEERGWQMKQDSNRGYRRVVPSPKPIRILEEESIKALLKGGGVVMCGGGGGIPVALEDGELRGVEAVIDKDYTACLLASRLGIPELVVCTGVDNVYLHFGTPEQLALEEVSVAEALKYIDEGHFPPGSMGPKVEALVRFIQQGGQRAIMTRLESLAPALQGKTGTRFVM